MGNPFVGEVSWDRHEDAWIGVFHPGYLHLLRINADGLRRLMVTRLAEHARGGVLGRPDPRLDALIWAHRMALSTPLPELEILIPAVNNLRKFLDALPPSGAVVELRGWPDRYVWGMVALDLWVALDAWLRAWSYGELVDGVPSPPESELRPWTDLRDWLNTQIVVPLRPVD
ncbi:hypothetical protein [Amycolatopsis suaedae]|uniref:Uncharacterized protein n=1 Tax=Amycolatopsis suaedae TaxID=2510978 RepID=A0A4Q7JA81_9PSEU|nr:hypothetical protein [Amycolatopsis suaedae]RZQ64169.1 hypothetical protein EWH70_09245 [Amycolatopsis suaedae]